MGAHFFQVTASGNDAEQAFWTAVFDARERHGEEGYTGTIAEKDSFEVVDRMEGETDEDIVLRIRELEEKANNPSADGLAGKWGPAACVQTGEYEYLFFGWASY